MRVYLDSMVWIYFLERNPVYSTAARSLMEAMRAGDHSILSSFLVAAEILVLPKRTSDVFTVASYKRILSGPGIISVAHLPSSPDLYAETRARYRTGPTDTLHAIFAAAGAADLLVNGRPETPSSERLRGWAYCVDCGGRKAALGLA